MTGIWLPEDSPPDTHAAFRGRFHLPAAGKVELRTLGASWFSFWLDGAWLLEGPDRFEPRHPQYRSTRVALAAGEHVVAVHAHHAGLTTRMLQEMPPFLSCRVFTDAGAEITPRWRGAKLPGYLSRLRRINPPLGWVEWCDTRSNPDGWQTPEFDDAAWGEPAVVCPAVGEAEEVTLGAMGRFAHALASAAEGQIVETFGYEADDPPVRFLLRDLDGGSQLPPQGVWRRYDLGRVRLGRGEFEIDAPPGSVVEIGYAERLTGGRVAPFITLSTGLSCNLDHFVLRGGRQTVAPLASKGGRYLEVHVLADDPAAVRFHQERFLERGYHGETQAAFRCGDERLERIWQVCVETYRACAEDAVVDNPTRERGQWTGDVGVALETASAAFHDLRLCRRALVQAAQDARADGLVSSLPPVSQAHATTYALQWVNAAVRYHELTGDASLLAELFPAARRNFAAFEPFITDAGLDMRAGWSFVDWGYQADGGAMDIAQDIHFLQALRAMGAWCERLGESTAPYDALAARAADAARAWFAARLAAPGEAGWEQVGYHAAALGLGAGLLEASQEPGAVAFIKRHLWRCFPNDPAAPRLSGPQCASRRLITPYFAHFAFPPLIERGETDFVLAQYRTCWGWMLDQGATTCLEVFDPRWSHCHQWSACPAWQLSRGVLGLHPRFDLGANHFVLRPQLGSLARVSGRVPLAGPRETFVEIDWEQRGGQVRGRLHSDEPLWLHGETAAAPPREVCGEVALDLPLRNGM